MQKDKLIASLNEIESVIVKTLLEFPKCKIIFKAMLTKLI